MMDQVVSKQEEQQLAIAIIPARHASTRLPGKPLLRETGKYLIEHVYERASAAERVGRVLVATDDQRIYEAVESFGGEVVMTRADHVNGTSRLAEVVGAIDENEGDLFVNVQGDEPELAPASIDLAIEALLGNESADVSTLAVPIESNSSAVDDPNVVKVVCDAAGCALYFSRARIPFDRDGGGVRGGGGQVLKHVGLYVYRRAFLLEYVTWAVTSLEAAECLEQLRILEHGRKIAVAVLDVEAGGGAVVGIDTVEQYAAFVRRYRMRHE